MRLSSGTHPGPCENLASLGAIGAVVLFAISGATGMLQAQPPAPDLVLSNGKIITVDERFTIAQAVAIKGNRIVAVGSNQELARLAGPNTRKIDLMGRAVTPGLIDNHMHLLRAATTWLRELRFDGVESRKQAIQMLRARAQAAGPGEWVYNIGRALHAFGIEADAPDPADFVKGSILRDPHGRPTGMIQGDIPATRPVAARLPKVAPDQLEASSRALVEDMNRAGLTSIGVPGCNRDVLEIFQKWKAQDRLNVRIFCIDGAAAGAPEQVDGSLQQIARMKLFQGDSYIDNIFFGESVYQPLHDPMFALKSAPQPDQLQHWRRLAQEIAKAGLPLHVHAELHDTIDAFLDQIEAVNQEHPIKSLRWTLAHVNQIDASQLERMKKLGMYAAVHPWAVINGGIMHQGFGDGAYDMPPLSTIQNSGIEWGFGTDGTAANQYLPFTTLYFAVTGKMAGGAKVLRQTIGREDALIAHTRKNAYLVFQENNLGSIQPGKLADLLVLDRDYLTVPEDQIRNIQPVMTMVGGRVVYDALSAPAATR